MRRHWILRRFRSTYHLHFHQLLIVVFSVSAAILYVVLTVEILLFAHTFTSIPLADLPVYHHKSVHKFGSTFFVFIEFIPAVSLPLLPRESEPVGILSNFLIPATGSFVRVFGLALPPVDIVPVRLAYCRFGGDKFVVGLRAHWIVPFLDSSSVATEESFTFAPTVNC